MSQSNAMQEGRDSLSYLIGALFLLGALFIYMCELSGALVLSHTLCLRCD